MAREQFVEHVFNECPGSQPLWKEPYPFKRLSAPGEVFVRQGVEWLVISSRVVDATNVIHTVVRRVAHGVPDALCEAPSGGVTWTPEDEARLDAAIAKRAAARGVKGGADGS